MPGYHREVEGIVINPADTFTLTDDTDGDPALSIENSIWADEPRMLLHFAGDGHDTQHQVAELVAVLHQLADEMKQRHRAAQTREANR
ncbi:hypothetical protein ACIO3S_17910 [Nocardioides sp. NPDC087217]|uniref:hypothetical protein n=1 Tax=Nocardioides sp. NPDC087217 TaxID=3364335 RepID=UPI003829DFA8